MPQYLSSNKATKLLGVTACTLRRWQREGRIQAIRSPGTVLDGHYLYDVEGLVPGVTPTPSASGKTSDIETPKTGVVYARVSSQKQRGDLERQKQLLLSKYPNYECFSDIASGLNFQRPQFKTLLERVRQGTVSEVVVTTRDRLCRFAFDLVKLWCDSYNTRITILVHLDMEQGDLASSEQHQQRELVEDILAINSVYIARLQGRRAAKYRRERRILEDRKKEAQTNSATHSRQDGGDEEEETDDEIGGEDRGPDTDTFRPDLS